MTRATSFQTTQIGVEVTPGTAVSANRALVATNFSPGSKVNINTFKPKGTKFPTLAILGKEWVEVKIDGTLTYDEIVYLLSSVITGVTPTGTGAAKTWVFLPNSNGPDNPKTFTVEQGSGSLAHRFTHGLVTALSLDFSRSEIAMDGSMLGKALNESVTMSAGATSLEGRVVSPTHVSYYIADTYNGLATAQPLDVVRVSWAIQDRFNPIWVLNREKPSFSTFVESDPKIEMKVKMEASGVGLNLYQTMRNGDTRFMRIEAIGAEIDTGVNEKLVIDTAVKVSDVSDFSDEDGLFAIEWTFTGVHDPIWGKATEITVVNEVSAL